MLIKNEKLTDLFTNQEMNKSSSPVVLFTERSQYHRFESYMPY